MTFIFRSSLITTDVQERKARLRLARRQENNDQENGQEVLYSLPEGSRDCISIKLNIIDGLMICCCDNNEWTKVLGNTRDKIAGISFATRASPNALRAFASRGWVACEITANRERGVNGSLYGVTSQQLEASGQTKKN